MSDESTDTSITPLPSLVVASAYSSFRLRCHAASWSDDYAGMFKGHTGSHPGLILLSATGPDSAARAIRAMLYQPDIEVAFTLEHDDEDEPDQRLAKARFDGKPVVYTAAAAKLAPGAIHLLAMARIPGLIPSLTDDHLWAELSGPRFNTPILRSWVGWLKREMIEDGSIVMAEGYGTTNVGVLTIDPEDLDEMVSDGVRKGYLKMETNVEKERA